MSVALRLTKHCTDGTSRWWPKISCNLGHFYPQNLFPWPLNIFNHIHHLTNIYWTEAPYSRKIKPWDVVENRPGSKSLLYSLVAVWPWAWYLSFLSLDVCICKMEIKPPPSQKWGRLHEVTSERAGWSAMVVHAYNSSTLGGGGGGGSPEVRSSRPAWPIRWNPVSTNHIRISQAWWCTPVVPATWEAEAGELLEPRRQRLQWAEIMPLHSILGNRVRLHLQK